MGLVWLSTSWTSRTVEGPRSHRTPRISSSASVGRNWEDFRMRKSYYEVIRSVNENLRSQILRGSSRRGAEAGKPWYTKLSGAILLAVETAPRHPGEMAERLKAHAWKACIGETLSRVRIPLSPP